MLQWWVHCGCTVGALWVHCGCTVGTLRGMLGVDCRVIMGFTCSIMEFCYIIKTVGVSQFSNDNNNDNEIDLFRHHNGNNTNFIALILISLSLSLSSTLGAEYAGGLERVAISRNPRCLKVFYM